MKTKYIVLSTQTEHVFAIVSIKESDTQLDIVNKIRQAIEDEFDGEADIEELPSRDDFTKSWIHKEFTSIINQDGENHTEIISLTSATIY